MKTLELKAPNRYIRTDENRKCHTVFLAGSIEEGTAEQWQKRVIDSCPFNTIFFNPRRDYWDNSWKQELNNPQFYQQVSWELDMLDTADTIVMYFDPNTKSPVSLLELGLYASRDMLVCCPEGFWRKGNVDIVCQRYDIPLFTNLETLIVALKNKIKID